FLSRTDQMDAAKKAVADAEAKLPRNESLALASHLALAQCYADIDELAKAREQLEAALKRDSGDSSVLRALRNYYLGTNDTEKALKYQEDLAKQTKDPRAARQAEAELALMLAATGDHQRRQMALALLEKIQKE